MRQNIFRFVAGVIFWSFLSPVWAEGLLGLVNPAQRAGQSEKLNTAISVQSFDAADYTSVQHYGDTWRQPYTPRDGTNLALSFARADVSFAFKTWSVGAFHRQEIFIASNKDITDAYYEISNNLQPTVGRTYSLNMEAEGFAAEGVRLDKAAVWDATDSLQVTFGAGISTLTGLRTRMGQMLGRAVATLNGYDYALNLNDAGSENTFPFMPKVETSGQGYAVDCGMVLRWQDGKQMELAINDLAGEIVWVNVPSTQFGANSATMSRDAQGYTMFNPTLAGKNFMGSFTQQLNTKVNVQFAMPMATKWTAVLGSEWMRRDYFPRLELMYLPFAGGSITAGYDMRFQTYALGVFWKGLRLNARTQSLSSDRSRGRGLEIGWRFEF